MRVSCRKNLNYIIEEYQTEFKLLTYPDTTKCDIYFHEILSFQNYTSSNKKLALIESTNELRLEGIRAYFPARLIRADNFI